MPHFKVVLAVIACKTCGQVHEAREISPGFTAFCSRCGSRLYAHTTGALHVTAALALSALILYWPAYEFPILRLEINGVTSDTTVWQGCVQLYQDGDAVIAGIVFLASIMIPLIKLLGLLFLVLATAFRLQRWKWLRTHLYRGILLIGRWSMLDVFVLAILVSLVKLEKLATVIPGRGLFAFGMVVVLTILASASFDACLIWERASEEGAM